MISVPSRLSGCHTYLSGCPSLFGKIWKRKVWNPMFMPKKSTVLTIGHFPSLQLNIQLIPLVSLPDCCMINSCIHLSPQCRAISLIGGVYPFILFLETPCHHYECIGLFDHVLTQRSQVKLSHKSAIS